MALFSDDSACSLHCTCLESREVRTPDGVVNLDAFHVHVFCSNCRQEMSFTLIEVDETESSIIDVQGEYSCECGLTMWTHASRQVPEHQQGQAIRTDEPCQLTEAEILVQRNRRFRKDR